MSSTMASPASLLHDPAGNPAHPAFALAAINRVRDACDAAQLLERLVGAVAAIGATAGLYSTLFPEQGDEPSSFTLFACDPRFVHEQSEIGPWHDHPWLRFARTRATPGTELDIRGRTQADRRAIELARCYGFASFLVVPTPAAAQLGRVGVLCLGSAQEGYFQQDATRFARLLAHALAAELHEWVTLRARLNLQRAANLAARDIELLSMQWQGLSSKAIAQRTGMSVAAVDSRFQRLVRRLECTSRRAAARRAAEYGLLEEHAEWAVDRPPQRNAANASP